MMRSPFPAWERPNSAGCWPGRSSATSGCGSRSRARGGRLRRSCSPEAASSPLAGPIGAGARARDARSPTSRRRWRLHDDDRIVFPIEIHVATGRE